MNCANECNMLYDLQPVFPKTYYSLLKSAKLDNIDCLTGFNCPNNECNAELMINNETVCPECLFEFDIEDVMKSNHFFSFDLQQLLYLKIKHHGLKEPEPNLNSYLNYCDSDYYDNLLKDKDAYKIITFQASCDGVEITERSMLQIWPLFIKINELNCKEDDKVFLLSCYIGTKKPDTKFYLKNFVHSCNVLSDEGIYFDNVNCQIYPFLFNFLLDIPARSHFLHHSGHCSFYGCTVCEIKGQTIFFGRDKSKHKVVFPPALEREYKNKLIYMEELPQCGVLDISILNEIHYVDCFELCPVEPMHLIANNFTTRFLNSMFKFTHRKLICSLYGKEDALNNRIKEFGTMDKFKSKPRPITKRSNFKASELITWLFYTSPIVLRGILSKKGYGYWMLIVYALSNYWTGLKKSDLDFNHEIIKLFLEDLELVFSKSDYTLNAHQLLHLKILVQLYGPLFCNNSFIYESANGECKRLIKGSFAINEQLANQYNLKFNLDLEIKNMNNDMRLCNKFKKRNSFNYYKRIVVGKTKYTSYLYECRKKSKAKNSVVKLRNNEYFYVRYYFEKNGIMYAKGKKLNVVNNLSFCYENIRLELDYIFRVKLDRNFSVIRFDDIVDKVHLVKSRKQNFVLEIKHVFHN